MGGQILSQSTCASSHLVAAAVLAAVTGDAIRDGPSLFAM